MKRIEVAAAIIRGNGGHAGKIFATERGYGPWKDYWEFPGGKLEPGETPEQALIREIREELDTEVIPERLFKTVEYDYPQFHLTLHCFICGIKSGRLLLLEHEDARWLKPEELKTVRWLPADLSLIKELEKTGAEG